MTQIDSASLVWVERLVGIETISRASNLGLIEMVRDYVRSLGLLPVLTYAKDGNKANLFCSVPDAGGEVAGGIVLSGHTDVVPVDGQEWATDPFRPAMIGDRIYGRGTSDMKGFLAVVLATMPLALTRRLSAPLHIALSFDEEVGCLGVPLLLQDLRERNLKPTGCIVGEPTRMRAVVGHKGFSSHRCTVVGRPAHSSLPTAGINAIERAAQLMVYIRELSRELQTTGPIDTDFDIPFSSVQIAMVDGGEAINIIPGLCSFEFTIRNLPNVDGDGVLELIKKFAWNVVLPEMKAEDKETDILFMSMAQVPGLVAQPEAEVVRAVRALLEDGTVQKVAYGSEAGLFQQAEIPTILCGPGDIARAHRPNEYIELRELRSCEAFLQSLLEKMSVK